MIHQDTSVKGRPQLRYDIILHSIELRTHSTTRFLNLNLKGYGTGNKHKEVGFLKTSNVRP